LKQITAQELEEKIKSGEKVNLIDVREDFEVAMGKIPEANHIPLGSIPEKIDELDKNQHYYMICRSGARSGNACAYLIQEGYDVTNISDGMIGWKGDVK